jgi:hypothetical protein
MVDPNIQKAKSFSGLLQQLLHCLVRGFLANGNLRPTADAAANFFMG